MMEEITDFIEQIDDKGQVCEFVLGALSGLVMNDTMTDAEKLSKTQYLLGYARGILVHFPVKSDANESV